MKRILLTATAAALMTATAQAHELKTHDHSCNVDLQYAISLDNRQVTLTDDGSEFALANGELRHNGKAIALSSADQQQLRRYEDGLRQLVPQVNAVTREALAIAGEATEFAFATLLGPDHESVKEMRGKFANLTSEIGKRMDDRHLPSRAMSMQDEDWNIAGGGASLGWSVLSASTAIVGKAMHAAFDEEYAKQWQAQLDQMEHDLDQKVEARAELLEAKAESLCANMTELEKIETTLAASNPALKRFDVVRLRAEH
ncbi:DUF2884 family protein [Permianibacter sp. IMCC34836]|uniref:DUF2884 family protein n=1 Tax=Permianibacter fluminis TaxID=2738515 RepID=UPI00155531AB|nr:DUF2884 family protein [Permianibacter fluminis]NQD36203.1 DUF2884 family protein [Permianibacter fluminis]